MKPGLVTQHLFDLIRKQVEEHGLVVWYDPDGVYAEAAKALELPDTTVMCYEGSFIKLRWEIDQKHLMVGEEPPRLVVYVPLAQDQTHHALIELEAAGVVMQPGQQPPARNTRLAVVARNALKGVLGEDNAAHVEKQTEAGKLTLADLDALAEKGGEISKGVIALIFGVGNPQEVALAFLDSDCRDERIAQKDAKEELAQMLRLAFGFDAPNDAGLADLRQRLTRHVLMTDLVAELGERAPSSLASVPTATSPATIAACIELARMWRLRRNCRASYVAAALQVEQELNLAALSFDPEAIVHIETFPTIERALLSYAETRLLEKPDGDMLTLAESRKAGFWCDAEPKLQARWALVASAAEVLLEAERVEKALNKAPQSLAGMIEQYAVGRGRWTGRSGLDAVGRAENDFAESRPPADDAPWCLLDTRHRRMESRWYNFEPYGDDHDGIEKLVIQARRRYVAVGSELARQFLKLLAQSLPAANSLLPPELLLRQQEVFETCVRPALGKKKTAYIWVDALRFEMGREMSRLLREDLEVNLYPALAAVPTVTEIGMAALLPGAQGAATVVAAGNGKLALEINGTVIKDRKDRLTFLKKHAGVEVFDVKLDNLLPKPSKKVREGVENAQLILVTSQEIDELCEQDNISQARRQMDGVLNDLRRGVRALTNMGVEHIVLAADHGHLFADELSEDMKVDPPGGETVDLHRRVWVGRGGNSDNAFLRLSLAAFGMQGDFDVATPWTFACFKCKGGAKAYFHGGLSPQELLTPVLTARPLSRPSYGPPSSVAWKLVPGSQKLSTRFFSVQVAGENTGLFEIEPPVVRVELRVKGKVVSRAVSASYGFEEATGEVRLRKDENDSGLIVPNTITLMVTEVPDQKIVGLHLLDAPTGAELARLEKIEVSIAM